MSVFHSSVGYLALVLTILPFLSVISVAKSSSESSETSETSETFESSETSIHSEFKWPVHGGTISNQNHESELSNRIRPGNVHNLQLDCTYESHEGQLYNGYIIVDNNDQGYKK